MCCQMFYSYNANFHLDNVQSNKKCFKTRVGNDQEKAQSGKRFPLPKPRWEKSKLTIRYLHHENISLAE